MHKFVQFLDFYVLSVQLYFINCLIHYVLDTSLYELTQPFKVNKISKEKYTELYHKYFQNVFYNVVISPIPFGIIAVYLINFDSLYDSNFWISECIWELCLTILVTDIIFYTTHRIMHSRYLYKYHKIHHEVTLPVSISALYVSDFYSFFNNTLPFILPSFFICSNVMTIKIWFCLIISESIFSHAGYYGWSEVHDKHHTKNNVNFGNNIFMDKLFKTYS
jgi:methylsterol monooxygenase